MLAELEDYDWAEVFGDETSGNTDKEIESVDCPDTPFTRDDVTEIIHQMRDDTYDGEPEFAIVCRLRDGRYLAATGWHDYTGWD